MNIEKPIDAAMDRAINQAGGMTALARIMTARTGKKTLAGSILHWKRSRVPAERVLDLEAVTGISRHEFRPDIYPP